MYMHHLHSPVSHVQLYDSRNGEPVCFQQQAPVPITAFWSNSKCDQNLECSSLRYAYPITIILHTARPLQCRGVCKISLRSVKYIINKSTANFGIWNSIEISLVERVPGLFSLRGKTSYRKISWSLEAARLDVLMIVSVWKFQGISPMCLSNFRAIGKV